MARTPFQRLRLRHLAATGGGRGHGGAVLRLLAEIAAHRRAFGADALAQPQRVGPAVALLGLAHLAVLPLLLRWLPETRGAALDAPVTAGRH